MFYVHGYMYALVYHDVYGYDHVCACVSVNASVYAYGKVYV